MATALEYQQLRDDLGHSITTLTDVQAEAIYVQAASLYGAGSVYAGTRVIALRQLIGSAAKLHSYTQNNSREEASDVFKHLMQLLTYWKGELADAVAVEDEANRPSAARFGRTTRKPARLKEHPNG